MRLSIARLACTQHLLTLGAWLQADAAVQKLQGQLLTDSQAAACHLAWLQHGQRTQRERAKLWTSAPAHQQHAEAAVAAQQPDQRSPKRLRLSPQATGVHPSSRLATTHSEIL